MVSRLHTTPCILSRKSFMPSRRSCATTVSICYSYLQFVFFEVRIFFCYTVAYDAMEQVCTFFRAGGLSEQKNFLNPNKVSNSPCLGAPVVFHLAASELRCFRRSHHPYVLFPVKPEQNIVGFSGGIRSTLGREIWRSRGVLLWVQRLQQRRIEIGIHLAFEGDTVRQNFGGAHIQVGR